MEVQRAWIESLVTSDPARNALFVEQLRNAGVDATPCDPECIDCAGICLFDEFTSPMMTVLQRAQASGVRYVLAVAAAPAIDGRTHWQLLQAGAADVLVWDRSPLAAEQIAARLRRYNRVSELVRSARVQEMCVGMSPVWLRMLHQIVEVAYYSQTSVLITGESGTGKEQVCRLIHDLDQRPDKRDLVLLDCTTIARELAGSEFFGHERGAFTGAVAARDGAFALADGGTLFLDEVGELPPQLQAELLRVIQEGIYRRVGSHTWQSTRFRLVCATNRDLWDEVQRGRFREDLYYRISGWSRRLPALRDRPDDILLLARHFVRQLSTDREPPDFTSAVRDYLQSRPYPGNVRDLKQTVTRMMLRHVEPGPVTVGCIPEEDRPPAEELEQPWCDPSFEKAICRAVLLGAPLKEIGRVAESTAVRIAVAQEQGNLQRAALRLGVTDRALQLRRAALRQATTNGT